MEIKKKSASQEREEVLHRIWLAQAEKLAERLEKTPAADLEASVLNVARQFLSDNGINSDAMRHADPDVNPVAAAVAELGDLGFLDMPGHDPELSRAVAELPEAPRRLPK